jgi:proline racemase/trans-L-3-hydroxyproline dehydratase
VLPSTIATTDYHTGGEPFRIVADPALPIRGRTVAERRARAIEDPEVQGLRAVLCSEPRGHADMYGGFIVPPDDDGADLGVLFWHKDGFSTACGHGTIALGVWAVETGRVAAPETGSVDVVIDVPSGRVTARVHVEDARVIAVDFVNVPSWVVASDVPVTTSRGKVRVTLAYGGAIYATLPAAQLDLSVTPEHLGDLIALGREIKWLLNDTKHAVHPTDPRLNGIYGTIWFDELGDTERLAHQRNVTIFADGEVDRSPAARAPAPGSRSSPPTAACPPAPCCGTTRSLAARSPGPCSTPSMSTDVPPSSPRSPARRTAPASTCSRSTRTTRWSRGSCCGEVH